MHIYFYMDISMTFQSFIHSMQFPGSGEDTRGLLMELRALGESAEAERRAARDKEEKERELYIRACWYEDGLFFL